MNNSGSSSSKQQAIANLRARREALGLTRAQLAVDAGCSITAIKDIEAGVTKRGFTRHRINRVLTDLEQEAA